MNKSITRLASVTLIGRITGIILQYLLSILIAHRLGAGALGAFALGLVILRINSTLAQLGLNTAVQKFIPIHGDTSDQSRLTGTTMLGLLSPFLAGVLLSAISYLSFDIITNFIGSNMSSVLGVLLLGVPLFATFRVGAAATRGFNETKYAVYIRDFGQAGSAFILAAIGIYLYHDIRAVAAAYVISLGIAVVLSVIFLWRQGAFAGIRTPTFETRTIFIYSLPVIPVAVGHTLVLWSDILMLGLFVPKKLVGYYQAAYQTSILLMFGLVAVNSVFPPIASKLYDSGDMDQLNTVYSTVTKWISAVTFLGAGFVMIFSADILRLFGPTFVEAQTALVVLALSRVVAAGVGPAGYLLSMTGYERVEMVNTIVLASANIILNFIFIQEYGILGAAMATGVSVAVLNTVRIVEIYALLDVWPYARQLLRSVIPLAVAFIGMFLMKGIPIRSLIKLPLIAITAFIIFALVARTVMVSTEDRLLLETGW